jgi:GT2 family glycosyltransferase
MCDVSVVIVNYNTWHLLRDCLASVLADAAESGLQVEVVVVDNGSTDGSPERVARHFPQVRLIRNARNVGYAAGTNQGIRASSGRNLLLLNSDTVVRPGALREMCAKLDARQDLAGVAPKLTNPDGTVQQSCWLFPLRALVVHVFGLGRLRLVDDYRSWDHRYDREVPWVSSAALMVPRRVLERVGLLDEEFFYGVDTDWCHRARRMGYRFLSLASAEVVHYGRGSRQGPLDAPFAGGPHVQDRYVRKHYGSWGAALFRGLLFFGALPRLVAWEVRHRIRPDPMADARRALYRRLLTHALMRR